MLRSKIIASSYSKEGQKHWKIFQGGDKDNSGYLEAKEFAKIIRRIGPGGRGGNKPLSVMGKRVRPLTKKEIKWLIRKLDTDKDGKISLDEFSAFIGRKVSFFGLMYSMISVEVSRTVSLCPPSPLLSLIARYLFLQPYQEKKDKSKNATLSIAEQVRKQNERHRVRHTIRLQHQKERYKHFVHDTLMLELEQKNPSLPSTPSRTSRRDRDNGFSRKGRMYKTYNGAGAGTGAGGAESEPPSPASPASKPRADSIHDRTSKDPKTSSLRSFVRALIGVRATMGPVLWKLTKAVGFAHWVWW